MATAAEAKQQLLDDLKAAGNVVSYTTSEGHSVQRGGLLAQVRAMRELNRYENELAAQAAGGLLIAGGTVAR